jgi:nucleoside-diphosphate-sugar epimerase
MTRILVTGGRGVLGSELTPRLVNAGYTVRVMSRSPGQLSDVEWAQADLETGVGVQEAVAGVDIIVNAASSVGDNTYRVDVVGTGQMLEWAHEAGVSHVVHVSIVGIDRMAASPYYEQKLAAENVIRQSRVPWTIVRITQFHHFIESRYLLPALKAAEVALPTDYLFQSIDVGEAAQSLLEAAAHTPAGKLLNVGGPEVLTLGDMARVWLEAQGIQYPIVHRELGEAIAEGRRAGYSACPDQRYGKITWAEWVARKYPNEARS